MGFGLPSLWTWNGRRWILTAACCMCAVPSGHASHTPAAGRHPSRPAKASRGRSERAFVDEGAMVITDDRNRDFYRNVVLAPQPRGLSPDRLSQFPFATTGPGTLALQTFTDRSTIADETPIIELYHVEGLNHAADMLVAYLPQSKILVNADLYSPPPQGGNLQNVNENAVALFNNVKRLKLDVAQHVPIHGNPGSQADFKRIV